MWCQSAKLRPPHRCRLDETISQVLARVADLATATGKEIAVTRQNQDKTAADERNRMVDAWTRYASTGVPLSDLGAQIVLLDTLRRVNLRKTIEVSAKGGKRPSPHVLAAIVKHLRARYGTGRDEVLDFVINALNPATQGDWKLEFKRRKGRPTDVGDLDLFSEYLVFREAYKVQGMKQAHKRVVIDLATKYGGKFATIQAAVRRGREMMGR
jgi:hypothetical protein